MQKLSQHNDVHSRIRSLRSTAYFDAFDAFTTKWISALDSPKELVPFLGADLVVGIDLLIEGVNSEWDLFTLQHEFLHYFTLPQMYTQQRVKVTTQAVRDITILINYLISQSRFTKPHVLYQHWVSVFQEQFMKMLRQMSDQTRMGKLYATQRPDYAINVPIDDYSYSYATQFGATRSNDIYSAKSIGSVFHERYF